MRCAVGTSTAAGGCEQSLAEEDGLALVLAGRLRQDGMQYLQRNFFAACAGIQTTKAAGAQREGTRTAPAVSMCVDVLQAVAPEKMYKFRPQRSLLRVKMWDIAVIK